MRISRTWKIIWVLVVMAFVTGIILFLKIWYMPHRDVTQETAVEVTAQGILDSYMSDEQNANTLYLDKAIQVTGEVQDIEETQQGKIVLSFKTSDPMAGVRCTMIQKPVASPGQSATVKGICKGYLMDVTLVDCYEVK